MSSLPEGWIREDLDGLGGDGEYGQHAAGDDITTIFTAGGVLKAQLKGTLTKTLRVL